MEQLDDEKTPSRSARFRTWLATLWERLDDPVITDNSFAPALSDTDSDVRNLIGFVVRGADGSVETVSVNRENDSIDVADVMRQTNKFVSPELAEARASSSVRDLSRAAASGGRVSVESQTDIRFSSGISEFIQMNVDEDSDVFSYSETYIKGIQPSRLLELLADASPELSRALFDFLLMFCPGWELKGLNDNDDLDKQADDYLKECLAKLSDHYHAPEVVFVKYALSAFLRGAMASEVVFDKAGREFVDIAMIDPNSLEHHRVKDETRGLIWTIYQRQGTALVDLNNPRVAYIPIHPFFGSNKGRSLAKPAIFVCFFLIATLSDLRRVIRQQGYPRIDIEVSIEKLKAMIPPAKAGDMQSIKQLADTIVSEVKTIYKGLKPDDTFIHTEVVKVNQPVGTLNQSSLGVVDGLLKAIERTATRALKTMPLLMATTDGVSEANANRQWEIHVAGIKSIQHYAEQMLESHFNLGLRARGIRGHAQFRFSELRAAELLRDAQVEALMTLVARQQYDNGSINADEMAAKSAHKDKADVQEPRAAAAAAGGTGMPTNPGGTNPEPGGNRSQLPPLAEFVRLTLQEAHDAAELVDQYAPSGLKGLLKASEAAAAE